MYETGLDDEGYRTVEGKHNYYLSNDAYTIDKLEKELKTQTKLLTNLFTKRVINQVEVTIVEIEEALRIKRVLSRAMLKEGDLPKPYHNIDFKGGI